MAALRPRIGKKNVRNRDALRRQQVANCVTKLQTQDAKIIQSGPRRALLDFADAAEQPFHREEIDLRMLPRIGQGKAPIARTEIEFDGMVVAEKLAPIQTLADVGQHDRWRKN